MPGRGVAAVFTNDYREPEGFGVPFGPFRGLDVRGLGRRQPGFPRANATVVNTFGQRVTMGRPRPPMAARFFAKSTDVFLITGQTRTGAGAPLAGATVYAFDASKNEFVALAVSDGSGNFSVTVGNNSPLFSLNAYLTGSPDRAGTTVRTVRAPGTVNIFLRDPTSPDVGGGSAVYRPIGSAIIRRISQ